METVGFVVGVMARTLDPISLAIAASLLLGGAVSTQQLLAYHSAWSGCRKRGGLLFAAYASSVDHAPLRFHFPQAAAAGFLQVWIISAIARRWQMKPEPIGVSQAATDGRSQ